VLFQFCQGVSASGPIQENWCKIVIGHGGDHREGKDGNKIGLEDLEVLHVKGIEQEIDIIIEESENE